MPPLNKKGIKSKIKTKLIHKRVGWLQKFFDEIQRNKMVKSIDFFIMFLSMTDKNEFEKKKKQIVKISDPKKLEEIKHLEGRAIVKVDSGKSILGRTILQFSTGIQTDRKSVV